MLRVFSAVAITFDSFAFAKSTHAISIADVFPSTLSLYSYTLIRPLLPERVGRALLAIELVDRLAQKAALIGAKACLLYTSPSPRD